MIGALGANAQDFDARLRNIRYYDGEGCGEQNPVKVSLCFAVEYSKPSQLSMVLIFSPGITYTVDVRDTDGEGNVYYNFCSKMGEASNFRIYFRDSEGRRSQFFDICAVPKPSRLYTNNDKQK